MRGTQVKIGGWKGLLGAGLSALLAAGGLQPGPVVMAAGQLQKNTGPASPALRKDADALLEKLAALTRRIRQIDAAIGKNAARLVAIDKSELPGIERQHQRIKAQADSFDREWNEKYAQSCGRDFRDEEEYKRWLKICQRQVARENQIEERLFHTAQAYTKLLGERQNLAKQNLRLAKLPPQHKAALDTLLMKLVSNPLLLACERCLRDIKSTLEVADCFQACWRPPG